MCQVNYAPIHLRPPFLGDETTTTTVAEDGTTTTTAEGNDTTTTTEKGICPAAAIYGEHSEEAELLRKYRDAVLNMASEGQTAIEMYYKYSPVISELIEDNEEAKENLKIVIDGMLLVIKEKLE